MAGPCPPLVLLLAAPLNSVNSVAGLCVQALSSSSPRFVHAPEPCQLCGWAGWCGWALWLASVSRPCPPELCVQALSTPLNSVSSVPGLAGLCGWALCSGPVLLCPPLGRELCQLCGWSLWHTRSEIRSRKARSDRALLKKTEKEKLKEKERERERDRKKERKKERKTERKKERKQGARALVCYGRLTGLLSSSCPLCWALWLGLVLFLSSPCPCLGRAPELCGWALCPGLVLLLSLPWPRP